MQSLLEEHVRDSFPLRFPLFVRRQYSERIFDHRLNDLGEEWVLVYVLVVLIVNVCHHLIVLHNCDRHAQKLECDHWVFRRIDCGLPCHSLFSPHLLKQI